MSSARPGSAFNLLVHCDTRLLVAADCSMHLHKEGI